MSLRTRGEKNTLHDFNTKPVIEFNIKKKKKGENKPEFAKDGAFSRHVKL